MTPKELSQKIAKLMSDKKAEDIMILDLRNLTTITDYFVICSASSDTQVKAIADHVSKELSKINEKPWHYEGYENLSWVLLDYVDVVAHIFYGQTRKFYNLEGLWGDAETEYYTDEVYGKK